MWKTQIDNLKPELLTHLSFIYGEEQAVSIFEDLKVILLTHAQIKKPEHAGPLDERDSILITYADQLRQPGGMPLSTLERFLSTHLSGLIRGVHILPFFPFSSDDGFSVIDYRTVNPAVGSWKEINSIASSFRLMVDAVINHISRESDWFQAYLQNATNYRDYFITVPEETDLSSVVRPRDLPLLTKVETEAGLRSVWTTFSDDQIDLNYANPAVLLDIIDLLFFYIEHGAQFIRLDAIAFIWKEIGHSSIHHPRTHRIVMLIRSIFDALTPWVFIITETNVPHEENIAYFGNGWNEAHMVYQFALPPLVLHTLLAGDARALTTWAAALKAPSRGATFFNFLASHDGIGLRPARGILTSEQVDALVQQCTSRGGGISYRALGDGRKDPYELNITYFDALAFDGEKDGDSTWIARFLTSQAIMLSLAGVPGIYFHSLFGSRNHHEGVEETGRLRSINRAQLQEDRLLQALSEPSTRCARVFAGYQRLLQCRAEHAAFNPHSRQRILDVGPECFAVLRATENSAILCLHNVSGDPFHTSISLAGSNGPGGTDLLNHENVTLNDVNMSAYQTRWIKLEQ